MSTPAATEVRTKLLAWEADRFASHMVLDRVPWLWADRVAYVEWKATLAEGLEVDPYSIVVVGSAAVGVTLSPKKQPFRQFNDQSDIDVAVVSHYHFELAWKTLRELGGRGQIPTTSQRRGQRQHREYLVFDGTIATDWILEHLPFGRQWRESLRESESQLPCERRDVKARIYRDVDALRAYQIKNIRKLKDQISAQDESGDIEESDGIPLATVDEVVIEESDNHVRDDSA